MIASAISKKFDEWFKGYLRYKTINCQNMPSDA